MHYSVTIDEIDRNQWEKILSEFDDASLYQTYAYGKARWGEKRLSHVAVKKGDKYVALAQLVKQSFPWPFGGIVYIARGPVWRRKKEEADIHALSTIINAMKVEYGEKKGFYVRIFPSCFSHEEYADTIVKKFSEYGFGRKPRHLRTLFLDISMDISELRMNLKRRWRKNLSYGQKKGLNVTLFHDADCIKKGLKMYDEMRKWKGFAELGDTRILPEVQRELPDDLKLNCCFSELDGEAMAALVWSHIGGVGLSVMAATSLQGRKNNASYLLWWKMIEDLKSKNIEWLDLGGINPERNRGGYIFKSGLAGKKGIDTEAIGEFHYCKNLFAKFLIGSGQFLRNSYRNLLVSFEKK